jgi:hypothetical protein
MFTTLFENPSAESTLTKVFLVVINQEHICASAGKEHK